MTQIISGATGSDFDPSVWQLPEIRTQVKEIDKHETETFKVIMKKNGMKMTLTPPFLEVASTHTPVDIQPWNIEPQKLKSYRCMWCDATFTTTNHACTRWRALFTTAPPRFPTLSTAAEATAKIPHNSSAEELTKFLRDHGEGEHLDQLGVPLEPESDQASR